MRNGYEFSEFLFRSMQAFVDFGFFGGPCFFFWFPKRIGELISGAGEAYHLFSSLFFFSRVPSASTFPPTSRARHRRLSADPPYFFPYTT